MDPPLIHGALENCALDDRKTLQDGTTIAVPYPKPGYNCNPYGVAAQKNKSIASAGDDADGYDKNPVDKAKIAKACKGVKPFETKLQEPYQYKGECMDPPLIHGALENCALDDRKTLQDGTTIAIPYPKPGYNCNPYSYSIN